MAELTILGKSAERNSFNTPEGKRYYWVVKRFPFRVSVDEEENDSTMAKGWSIRLATDTGAVLAESAELSVLEDAATEVDAACDAMAKEMLFWIA